MPIPGVRLGDGSMAGIHELVGSEATRVVKIAKNSKFNANLLQEARLTSELVHEALLPVLDFGVSEEGLAWLVLPRLSGRTLADLKLEAGSLIEALGPVADILDRMHQLGWVHGDLKPANILEGNLITPLILADLGLALRVGDRSGSGSPAYLSPRRLNDEPLNFTDDLFAFAVLCFESLTGRLPFVETQGDALLRSIRNGQTHALSSCRSDLPGELDGYFQSVFSGRATEPSLTLWLDGFRSAFNLEPAAARLRYRQVEFPHAQILMDAQAWLDAPSFSRRRLGRAILLRGAGKGEARGLRFALEARRSYMWIREDSRDRRSWIAGMEHSLAEGEDPEPAVFASRELDDECESYLLQRPDTLLVDWPSWTDATLRDFLQAGLASPGLDRIEMGIEEFRFLRDQPGGDLAGIEDGLSFLADAGILRCDKGRTVFVHRPESWGDRWLARFRPLGLSKLAERLFALLASLGQALSPEECAEALGAHGTALSAAVEELLKGGWILRADGGGFQASAAGNNRAGELCRNLAPDWFPMLWARAGSNHEARARLIIQAGRQKTGGWLSDLDPVVFLELADGLSLPLLEDAVSHLDDSSLRSAMGTLSTVVLLRNRHLPEAVDAFWCCESSLDLQSSAELSRRLFTDLMEHLSLDDGYEFLESWRHARAAQIEGRELEIRVAARECISFGKFGDLDEALRRLDEYRARFAGRSGEWFLDWAEGQIQGDRRNRLAAARAMSRALDKMPDDAELTDRFSLNVQTANQYFLLQDIHSGLPYLEAARVSADQPEAKNLDRYLESCLGLLCKTQGDLKGAESHYRHSLQIARDAGIWREPLILRGNLANALLELGEYGRLLPILRKIRRHVELGESFREALHERSILASAFMVLGDLESAERYITEILDLAGENGSDISTAGALLRRCQIHRIRGNFKAARSDLKGAFEYENAFSPSGRVNLKLEAMRLSEDLNQDDLLATRGIIEESKALDWIVQRVWARILQSRILWHERRFEESWSSLQEAMRDAQARGNPELLWAIHAEGSELFAARGEMPAARTELGRAIDVLQVHSKKIDDAALRRIYLERPDRLALLKRYRTL